MSQKIEDITLQDYRVFLDIFEIFAEDCFLLRGCQKFLLSGFLPLIRFQPAVLKGNPIRLRLHHSDPTCVRFHEATPKLGGLFIGADFGKGMRSTFQ